MKLSSPSFGTALGRLALTNQHLFTSRCSSSSSSSQQLPDIIPYNQGTKYTPDYANYATTSHGKVVSYFHDIALDLNKETKEANIVIEIPRWTNAKFEINTKLAGNPIVQDTKNGKVRFVKNLFPTMDISTTMEHSHKPGKIQPLNTMGCLVTMTLLMCVRLDQGFYLPETLNELKS